jgi:hypothetical protein
MAALKSFPSLAPDVDPATAKVPVGGYVVPQGGRRRFTRSCRSPR